MFGEGGEQLIAGVDEEDIDGDDAPFAHEEIRGMAVEGGDGVAGPQEGRGAEPADADIPELREAAGAHEVGDQLERRGHPADRRLAGDDVQRLPLVDDPEQLKVVAEDGILEEQPLEILQRGRAAERGLEVGFVVLVVEEPLRIDGEAEAVRLREFYNARLCRIAPDEMLFAAFRGGREIREGIERQSSRTRELSERCCFAISA